MIHRSRVLLSDSPVFSVIVQCFGEVLGLAEHHDSRLSCVFSRRYFGSVRLSYSSEKIARDPSYTVSHTILTRIIHGSRLSLDYHFL